MTEREPITPFLFTIIAVVIGVLVMLASAASGQEMTAPETELVSVIHKTQAVSLDAVTASHSQSVCRVIGKDGAVNYIGTGCYIGNGFVVTAGHVYDEAKTIACEFNGNSYPVNWFATYTESDIGLLRLSQEPAVPAMEVVTDELDGGETVYLIGFDHGQRLRVYDGRVDPTQWSYGRTKAISHERGTQSSVDGNSGGPIFNAEGKLVSVLWGAAQGQTFANSNTNLVRFIHQTGQRFPLLRGLLPQCANGQCPPQQQLQPTYPQPIQPSQPSDQCNCPPGPAGPPGADGQDGLPGKPGTVDYAEVRRIVREELASLPPDKPIYLRRVNGETGELISSEPIEHGEGFTFYEYPGVRAK